MGIARNLLPSLLAVLLTALGGCAGVTRAGAPATVAVPPESLVTASGTRLVGNAWTRDVAYVLVGEEHPNPCDHLAQAAVIRRLAAAGLRPVIGLEMVPADRQDILDAFNRGALAVDDLPRALDWPHTWGFDFRLYAPIFQAARDLRLPVFACNVPTGLARKVGRAGLAALTPAERAALPGTIIPPAPAQETELREFFEQHQAMLRQARGQGRPTPAKAASRDPLAAFLTVQSLWDTQMASRARYARALYDRPVVVVAGTGHVEHGWGIARRLRILDPGAAIVLVLPWRGDAQPDQVAADLFYACPVSHHSRLGMTFTQEAPAPDGKPVPPLVTEVVPDSPAAQAGLLAGDALTAAGGRPVTSLTDLHLAGLAAAKAGKPLVLTVHRGGEDVTVTIPLTRPQP